MTQPLLIDVPRRLTPWREYLRSHRIKTHFDQARPEPWTATRTIRTPADSLADTGDEYTAVADTEEGAIADLIAHLHITPYEVWKLTQEAIAGFKRQLFPPLSNHSRNPALDRPHPAESPSPHPTTP
jgi:hypothetical protein